MSFSENKIEKTLHSHQVILFDGSCSFCNWSVNFILRKDSKKIFYFSSLQSKTAIEFLATKEKSLREMDSIMLFDKKQHFTKSSAALQITKQLSGISKLLYVFMIIPKPIRDWVYDFIAKRRQSIFKEKNCRIPSTEEMQRFIS